MSPARKLLVLALDAANPELLRRWSADGTLPNLAGLMSTGLVNGTRGVEGLYVGATWPSFYTGHHPGNHGLYWLDRLKPGTYRMLGGRPHDFGRRPAFWEVLSRAGKEVLVLDVPLTRRSPALRGVQTVEWGVHDAAFGFQTTPRALKRKVLRTVGPHPAPSRCDAPCRSLREYCLLAEQLIRGAEARSRLTRDLLASRRWDCAIQVFSETHCGGHQLWHFHDPTHPAHNPEVQDSVGNLLRKVYVAVDQALGEILAAVGKEVTVLVVSLHSMSFACGSSLVLPEVLRRLGVFAASGDAPGVEEASSDRSPESILRRAYRRIPEPVRAPVYRLRQYLNDRWLGRGVPLDLIPGLTQAFPIGLGTGAPFSGIRLNVQGREPRGIVSPGAEEDRVIAELTRDLSELTDPDSGRHAVARVLRTSELYPGPFAGELPDLLVEWDSTAARGTSVAGSGSGALWRVSSPKVGEVSVVNSYCRTGEHRGEGLLVASGPGIANSGMSRITSILEYAPTIARFFGTSMPASDGQPIEELLA